MILFYKDWYKYPEAIIHSNTKNQTWVRTALLFKKMGIKNHAFHLSLLNPKLKDIDPFDPDLTEVELAMIGKEAYLNPWYFYREILRIPTAAGPVYFRANRANISIIWNYYNHITTYVILPRQTGKSITIESILVETGNTRTKNNAIGILTKDEKLRGKTSEQIRDILETLPAYIRMLSKKDVKNSEKITIKRRNNVIQLFVPGTSETTAAGKGRGLSMSTTVIDEFAFIRYIDVTIPAFLTASTAVREQAKEAGLDYGTIFTTTPGKLNTREGKFAYEIYKKSLRWSETFFDLKDINELNNVLKKNSANNGMEVMLLEYNHRQLGYTDDWLRERIKAALLDASPDAVEAELLNKWTGGTHKSPIPKETLEIIQDSEIKDYITKVSKEGYVLRYYVKESELRRMLNDGYISIGLDTSEGIGKDDIALVARYSKTGEVVYAGDFNETNTAIFASFIAELLMEYPNTVLVPERRSTGISIIDNIVKILLEYNINPFKKIYNKILQFPDKYEKIYKELMKPYVPSIELINKYREALGFATSSQGYASRSGLYGNVFSHSLKYTAKYVRDKKLIDELASLTVKNGRIDHEEGSHDDMVIAWLLSYWFILQGENKKNYDIKNTTSLTQVIDNILEKQNISKEEIVKQNMLKNKIQALIKELQNTIDPILALRLVAKIRMLEKGIDNRIISNFDIDSILEEIKIIKRIKKNKGLRSIKELKLF